MGVATATISSDGKPMNPAFGLVALDVSVEVNRIPRAELRLLDGSAAERQFAISNESFFEPGKEVEIKLRYEGGEETTVFKGLVLRHGVEAGRNGMFLNIGLKDAAVKLTGPRRSAVFTQQSDAEVIGKLLGDAGLRKGTVAATEPKHEEIVQYRCTDWDFILARADLHGLLVSVELGEVSARKIELAGSPKHTFELGLSEIFELEMEVDAGAQPSDVFSVAWDIKTQKPAQASRARAFTLAQGNLEGDALAKQVGFGPTTLAHMAPLAPKELQAWADATMARSRMAMIRGRLSVPGIGSLALLDLIEVVGVGERFNGKTLVTGLRHRLGDDGWLTDIQFGLSPAPFSREPDIEEPPAAGLLPGVSGLQIGVVDAFEEDPDKEFRLRVVIPGVDEETGRVWARLTAPDAGKARGFFFRPEVGDEVVLGFLNEDPRQPVVLGSLFGSKNAPPADMAEIDDKNIHKGLVSQSGTTIGFVDDEKPSFFIATPAKNKILLDDDNETIELADQHGNKVTLSKDGIVLESAKDVTIDASGNVEIKGAKVDVK